MTLQRSNRIRREIMRVLVLTLIATACLGDTVKTTGGQSKSSRTTAKQGYRPELVTQTGHAFAISSVVFSPDGKTLASASYDATVKLWDAVSGQQLRTLVGNMRGVSTLAFSHDGKTVALASTLGKTIKLWDVFSGKEIRTFPVNTFGISSIVFSRDGKTLISLGDHQAKIIELRDIASGRILRAFKAHNADRILDKLSRYGKIAALGGDDNIIKLWDMDCEKELRNIEVNYERADSIEFSPDGKTLAVQAGDIIELWQVASGRKLHTVEGHSSMFRLSPTFSPDSKIMASGGDNKTIKLWDVASGQLLKTLKGNTDWITKIAFSPDGKTLASGSSDRNIILWDVAGGSLRKTLECRNSTVNLVLFSPDGKLLVTSGIWDHRIKLWDMVSGQILKTLEGHTSSLNSITFSPDGKTLASGSGDKTIRLWDVTSGQRLRTLRGHTSSVEIVAFSPDGNIVASVGGDGGNNAIKLWDVASGRQIASITGHVFEGHTVVVSSVAFSSDGKMLASAGADRTIKLWDTASGKKLKTFTEHVQAANSVAFSKDDKMLVSAGGMFDRTIRLWDVNSGKLLRRLSGNSSLDNFGSPKAFSQDGKMMASVKNPTAKEIELRDINSGQEFGILTGHARDGLSIVFSPDNKTLASGSFDKTIKLWDATNGKELRTLAGHTDGIYSLAFSPNGKTLASGSFDKAIKLWDAASGRLLRTFKGHNDSVRSVSFSSNGKTLISVGTFDKTSKLWDVVSGRELNSLEVNNELTYSASFSPDGKTLASTRGDNIVKLWDVASGKELNSLQEDSLDAIREIAATVPLFYNAYKFESISPDRRLLVRIGRNGGLDLYDLNTGKLLANLTDIDKSDWLVTTPEGFFDGTPAAWKQIIWRFNNNTFEYSPVELYFNDFFYPNLLQDVLARRSPKPKAGQELDKVDRRQPQVEVSSGVQQIKSRSNAQSGHKAITDSRTATVTIEVADNLDKKRQLSHEETGGAQDLRLFRNGSLVRVWHDDLFKLGAKDGCRQVTQTARWEPRRVICQTEVPIMAGENVFTAYAFNRSNIKSQDSAAIIRGADVLKREGTLYVLAIGVNQYANQLYNLKFAVPDVEEIGATIKIQQDLLGERTKLKQYASTELITLTEENAMKTNVLLALRLFAANGKLRLPESAPESLRQELAKIKPTQPEDALIIYFAGHGTSRKQRFYLLPHDFTGADENSLIEQGISDIELNQALENVDAGRLLMAIDACQSGHALGAKNEGQAPMNSKGLAQLAYDKGMSILTAAQSQQAAVEGLRINGNVIKHGLLTYVLLQGLTTYEADRDGNQQIWEREWLEYAAEQVPLLQLARIKQHLLESKQSGRDTGVFNTTGDDKNAAPENGFLQRPRVFYRREPEIHPLIMAKP